MVLAIVVAAGACVVLGLVRVRLSVRRYVRTGRRDRWTAPHVPPGTGALGPMSPQRDPDLGRPGTTRTSTRKDHGEL